jgi:tetratricopeptide (TPR) repeat protein
MGPSAGTDGRALAFAAMMAWVSQAAHSATDFGLLRPANGLLLAVLMGLMLSEAIYTVRLNPAGRWLSLVRLPGWTRFAFGLVCVAVAGLGVWEYARAANCATALQAVPELDRPTLGNDTIQDVDFHIQALEAALAGRRDDADVRFKLAQLWVHRYRLTALAELRAQSELVERITDATLWRLSHPSTLQQVYMQHVSAYGPDAGQSYRELPAVVENLRKAMEQLKLARRSCPVSRQIDYLSAQLGVASPEDPDGRRSMYRSLFANPARSARLIDVGQLAWQAALDELAMVCFRRGLGLSGRESFRVWTLLRQRVDDHRIIEHVLPDAPEALFQITDRLPADDPARPLLIEKLEAIAEQRRDDSRLRGQVAELKGDSQSAIEAYRIVLAETPEDLDTRIRIVRCHVALGDFEEANRQLGLGLQLAPDSAALLELKKEILETELDQ